VQLRNLDTLVLVNAGASQQRHQCDRRKNFVDVNQIPAARDRIASRY